MGATFEIGVTPGVEGQLPDDMPAEDQRRDELAGKLFGAGIAMLELGAVYLGDRLGLYQALKEAGPATSAQLADRTGTHERYTREWLEQQAVAGILDVDDLGGEAGARAYNLPAGHAEVLTERDSLAYLAPLARTFVGVLRPIDALVEAFRTGGGVPYPEYGIDTREGIAAMNRPMFINLLTAEWLPALPDVHSRLQEGLSVEGRLRPARVADIACGAGWSTIAMAKAYPMIQIDGFDSDEASIELARKNIAEADLSDRVTLHVQDAAKMVRSVASGPYDLVTIFEALHDMARPVEALRAVRGMLAPGGAVLIADERVAERFIAPGDEVERFMYGASVLHCLPVGMAEQPSAGTGTVIRPDTVRRYAMEAGFGGAEILPIENDFWRFYRLGL
jgi:2-polyprenyl-3-methyl-5-hydroxy-6-metoxy-1,4-benzoquinol methylase